MNRKAKTTIVVVVVAFILIIGGMGLKGGNRSGISVRVETVTERDLIATVTGNGWVRPRRSVDLQADIMGRITRLWVREGDSVQVGQVLLQIDPTEYEAAVSRAQAGVSESEARLAQARANLMQAERALERTKTIAARDPDLVSEQELEDALTQVRSEEHTSELQSRGHLVCRLLLEK